MYSPRGSSLSLVILGVHRSESAASRNEAKPAGKNSANTESDSREIGSALARKFHAFVGSLIPLGYEDENGFHFGGTIPRGRGETPLYSDF